MYNEDDAVAKIDGYVISVVAAGRFIGERKLVRIEKVGRTSADAVIVGEANGEEPSEESAGDGKPRRRGRRGGRGRRKPAATKAEES